MSLKIQVMFISFSAHEKNYSWGHKKQIKRVNFKRVNKIISLTLHDGVWSGQELGSRATRAPSHPLGHSHQPLVLLSHTSLLWQGSGHHSVHGWSHVGLCKHWGVGSHCSRRSRGWHRSSTILQHRLRGRGAC